MPPAWAVVITVGVQSLGIGVLIFAAGRRFGSIETTLEIVVERLKNLEDKVESLQCRIR